MDCWQDFWSCLTGPSYAPPPVGTNRPSGPKRKSVPVDYKPLLLVPKRHRHSPRSDAKLHAKTPRFFWLKIPIATPELLSSDVFPEIAASVHKHGYKIFSAPVLDALAQRCKIQTVEQRMSFLCAVWTRFLWDEHATAARLFRLGSEQVQSLSISEPYLVFGAPFEGMDPPPVLPVPSLEPGTLAYDLFREAYKEHGRLLQQHWRRCYTGTPFLPMSTLFPEGLPAPIPNGDAKHDETLHRQTWKHRANAHATALVLLTPDHEYLASIFAWPSPIQTSTLAVQGISGAAWNLVQRKYKNVAECVFQMVAQWAQECGFQNIVVDHPIGAMPKLLDKMGFRVLDMSSLVSAPTQEVLRLTLLRKVQESKSSLQWSWPWGNKRDSDLAWTVFDQKTIPKELTPDILALVVRRHIFYYWASQPSDDGRKFVLPTARLDRILNLSQEAWNRIMALQLQNKEI